MARLRDVIAYLCHHYPHKQELSKARLTKMVYLADWRSAITRGSQITDVGWHYNYYGPYVEDVVEVARNDPAFEIVQTANVYGGQKEIIRLIGEPEWPSLTEDDATILDFVIKKTSPLYWNDFIRIVYSTYPMVSQPRHAALNLVQLARSYEETQGEMLAEAR